jgi:protein-S-isoprenylcysteine O-methyltransferase Ste14
MMFMLLKIKAAILVPLLVSAVVATFFTLGYYITNIFGLPFSLALPFPVRLFGLFLIAFGLMFLSWLFAYRKPVDILISTYVTVLKAMRGTRLEEKADRTEPLVIVGPYKHVRHPLYFSVVILLLGWWLLLDLTFLLFSTVLLMLYFNYVVAPFEEAELRAIFGEQYKRYIEEVPRLIPFTKHLKKSNRKEKMV